MGPSAQLLALLVIVLGGAIAIDATWSEAPLLGDPLRSAAVLAVPVGVAVVIAEMAVYRELWWFDRTYVTGIRVPRRLPIEEVVGAFAFAIAACAAWGVAGRGRRHAGKDQAVGASASSDGFAAGRPPGWRRATGLVLAIGAAGVAALAVIDGFAHSSEGQQVRIGLGRTSRRLAGVVDVDLPDLTALVLALVVLVVAIEIGVLRTGTLARRRTWITVAAIVVLSAVVDGWTTKASSPIVRYAADEYAARLPLSRVPVEIVVLRGLMAVGVAIGATWWDNRAARARHRAEQAPFSPVRNRTSSAPRA